MAELELDTFTLFLSWKCNFTCSHCGFSCSPQRNEKMDIKSARSYIEEASTNPNLKMVAYSGGEPFLFYEELKELMSFSYNKGLRAGVVTNCFWSDSPSTAAGKLNELKELGLDEVITSIDDYHLEHVNINNVKNLIEAAISLRIRVGINILMTLDSQIRKDNLHEFLNLPEHLLKNPENAWMRESSPIRVGRAKKHFEKSRLKQYGEIDLMGNPCHYVIRNTVVAPDGSTYACCGFGGASEHGPSSITFGGNINKRGFNAILEGFKANLLLNIISSKGPYVLLKMAQETDPTLKIRTKFVSICDVCEEISSNLQLRNILKKLLNELSASVSSTTESILEVQNDRIY